MTAEEKRLFHGKKPQPLKLKDFGFREENGVYRWESPVLDGQFQMCVSIDQDLDTELIDTETGEAYVLHRVAGASGSFVGAVRDAHEQILRQIAEQCYDYDVFQSPCTKALMDYIRRTYGDELEYPWPKVPENAVWRRQDTRKWYGALLIMSRRKLGLDSDEPVEILDLRIPPEKVEDTIDFRGYFPGFHMNKRHWYTILLDGTVPPEEIFPQIDRSYQMAKK